MYGALANEKIRKLIEEGNSDMIPADDLKLYKENQAHRGEFDKEAMKQLYSTVALQAVVDYKAAIKKSHSRDIKKREEGEKIKEECEIFFDTPFFQNVSGVKGKKKVLQAVRKLHDGYESLLENQLNKRFKK